MNPWQLVADVLVKLIEKVAGFLAAFFMGRGYERGKQRKDTVKAYEEREDIENNIVRLPDDKRRRLRDKWTRK